MINKKSQFLNKIFLLFALAGFLLIFNQEKLDSIASFLLQAASVVLGFPLDENILYAFTGGLVVLLVRSVLTIVGHMSYAIIWGFTWGEYKQAIPVFKMGLNKYPKSYELNKRMGVFNIYTQKYKTAKKYLRTATRISPRKAGGRFNA